MTEKTELTIQEVVTMLVAISERAKQMRQFANQASPFHRPFFEQEAGKCETLLERLKANPEKGCTRIEYFHGF